MAKDFAELNRLENEAGIQAPEAGTKEQLVNKFVKAWENETARRAVKGGTGLTMALTLAACGGSSDGGFAFAPSTQGDDAPTPTPTPVDPGPAGETFALTAGIDNLTGTAGDDVFDASPILNDALNLVDTLGALDVINGGDGTDTLNVVDTDNFVAPAGVDLNSIEIVNVNAAGTVTFDLSTETDVQQMNVTGIGALDLDAGAATAVTATTTNVGAAAVLIDGGSTVDVTAAGINNGTITVGANSAASGDVVVNATGTSGTSAIGAITVTGGDTVTINQTASNVVNTTTTLGAVTVNGDAGTTAVTVNNVAAADADADAVGVSVGGVVTIDDAGVAGATADTITTVTLSNFGNATITSSALATLNVTGGSTALLASGNIDLANEGTVSPATTLALNSAGGFMGSISGTQADDYTTINVASSAATTFADLDAALVETINFSGAGDVTFNDFEAGQLNALTDINVTGTGGVVLGGTVVDQLALGTDFDGNAGDDSVVIGATTQGITMGAGDDTVLINASALGATGSVDAGAGTGDTLIMSAADALVADNNTDFEGGISGFEVLSLTGAMANLSNLNLANLDEINSVVFEGVAAAGVATISNFSDGGSLSFTGNGAGTTTNAVVAGAAVGTQSFTLDIDSSVAGGLDIGTFSIVDVETLNITAADADADGSDAVVHVVALDAADTTSIVVSGNNGLNITTTDLGTVTSFDASGIVANAATLEGQTDDAADLAVTFASGNTTATAEVSIIGGEGDDNLTGNASIDTISGGAGDDTINGGDNSDVLTGGAGADTFVFGPGSSGGNPTVAGNFDEITDFNTGGSDVISLGLVVNLTIDASSNSAPIGTAAISNEGIATFNAADNLLSEQVIAVEDALGGDIAGEFAVFENENGNSYVFVSDNVAGVGAGDVLIQLTGVTGLSDTTLTGGDLTIA